MVQPVAVAWSQAPDTRQAVDEVCRELAAAAPSLVLVFHSTAHPAEVVADQVAGAFSQAITACCTTMGELGGGRFLRGAIAAIGFGGPARAAAVLIPDLRSWRFQEGAALIGSLCDSLGLAPGRLTPGRHLFLTLVDGLSGFDELLLTAISDVAPGVPVVGGCAADDGRFQQTLVSLGRQTMSGAALLVLLEPGVPFHPFAVHHFRPTGAKVVVTRADPARRRVSELDGWPAVSRYARLCGLPADHFQRNPSDVLGLNTQFAVGGQGQDCLRGVMAIRDQELVMAGAVEEGELLEVVAGDELVESTTRALSVAVESSAGTAGARAGVRLLLFSCGGRFAAAHRTGLVEALGQAMAPVPSVGFSTYGEHFGASLVNYTLSGVAFGASPDAGEA
ncbi:FIST C-terminal domain-containing protein [Myxococcota bacterium]|nr:FIST C-terminal domain-containing protein [Myxococcota bacterium]